MLGAGENDRPVHILVGEQFHQQVALLGGVDENDALIDPIRRLRDRRDRDFHGVAQQFAGEHADVGRHRRREEQVLALARQIANDALDRPDEAEIEHLVDFIEHQELHLVQVGVAGVHMVDEAARCGDKHVNAGRQRADLRPCRHAAEDDGDFQVKAVRQILEALGDLARQFAGGAQHQHAGAAQGGRATVGNQLVEDRQREGRGLAGAGLGDADEVAPLHQRRDRLRLDRRRRGIAELGERMNQRFGKAEPEEILQKGIFL